VFVFEIVKIEAKNSNTNHKQRAGRRKKEEGGLVH
jgi:hypothetical protein